MKKSINKIILTLAIAASPLLGLTSCNSSADVKIGVLVADVSGEEATAFKTYMTDYVAKQYDNVTIEYTAQLTDAAGEKSAIEDFAGRGFNGIISMSSNDRATQLKTASENHLYYAVGSGMLDDSVYQEYKSNEYFVGQVGPDNATEYQAGYDMGKYYKDEKHVTKVGMYGAFIPNPMHIYRAAGVLVGLGLSYDGETTMSGVVGKISSAYSLDPTKISGDIKVEYMAGFDQDTPANTYAALNTIMGSDIDAFLSVGMTTTFFSASLNGAGIEYSDIDSFTASNKENMETGKLGYLAGKYASSLGPVYALIANAVNGRAVRDANGYAPSLSQGYGVAKSAADFANYAESGDNRIYNKSVLDSLTASGITYSKFAEIVASK